MKNGFAHKFILLILLCTFLCVGCTSGSSEAETTDPNKVTDIVWEWEALKTNTGETDDGGRPIQETTEIANPENYTLILREDGNFSGKADCNQISGTYTTENNGYQFTLGPSTRAACGENSLDQQYLDLLSRVVAGGPNGDKFALETPAGGERMEFRNGGTAPAQ